MVVGAKIQIMRDFSLISEVREYNTAHDPTNSPEDILVTGSQNVIIDRNRKVRIRNGYSRLGAANAALTPILNGKTWNSSTGANFPVRAYDVKLEVYLETIDATVINAWKQIKLTMTGNTPRFDTWYDDGEKIDLLLFVMGDVNIYEWGGGVSVVASVTANTITKAGTTTFAQNRFYATRNMTLINVRTGTEFTYSGGTGTLTLTGVSGSPVTDGMVAGDVLVQKPVTNANSPSTTRINDTIFVFENQLILGSLSDNQVYLSKNNDFDDFAYSAPRIAGEGGLLTLDGPSGGIGVQNKQLIAFSGRNSIFTATYTDVTVGTTISEVLSVQKVKTGVDQGCQSPDTVVSVGSGVMYLSYEPALRLLDQAQLAQEPSLKTLSNPIKPDFDAEDWTGAKAIWYKQEYILTAETSRMYILEAIEDADGKTSRYWQPPQILPVNALVVIDDLLHGHSNAVAETYKLNDGNSDIDSSDDKIPINAIAAWAYRVFKHRALLKNFDEFFVEGEITPAVDDLTLTINYDYGGHTQQIAKTIDGTDEDILQETVSGTGLGQNPLGQNPLGGLLVAPSDARKFQVQFEIAREDFTKLQPIISSNGVDKYWSILALGPNAVISARKNIGIKK